MWFDEWKDIWRILAVGSSAYLALVFMLRLSGKRTLSKMNAFDLVVTVAFGSTLATVLLSSDVTLAEGVTAFALLVFLQAVITWLSVRSARFQSLIKATPTLLAYKGEAIPRALRDERVTLEELQAALRESGLASIQDVHAIVLETDGSISVVRAPGNSSEWSLRSVRRSDK